MYRASFIILYFDQQMHNYFTNYHTVICMLLSRQCYMSRPTQIILSDYGAMIIIIINHYYY